MPGQTVFYDACVLYPAGLRSTLMYLGLHGLVQPRWSEAIHEEWTRNVLNNRKDITRDQLERTRRLMNTAIPDSLVRDYEHLIETLDLPDPDDQHVLAAAIHVKAEAIVTFNHKDFPAAYLSQFSIETVSPDTLILRLLNTHPDQVVHALHIDRIGKKRPPKSPEEYLAALTAQRLPKTSDALREFIDSL